MIRKIIYVFLRIKKAYMSSCCMRTAVLPAILFFLVTGLSLAGCQRGTNGNWDKLIKDIHRTFPTVKHISTEELQQWMEGNDVKPLLIDRREKEEYDVSHLFGAFHAADKEEAIKIVEKEGKDRTVVVYCSVGYRSSVLARQLEKEGYTNVYNLEGSIFKWANEGRPIYQGDRPVHVVHPYNSKWRTFLDRKLWYTLSKQE